MREIGALTAMTTAKLLVTYPILSPNPTRIVEISLLHLAATSPAPTWSKNVRSCLRIDSK